MLRESHPTSLLADAMATRTQLIERHPGARFLAFWDLDGTLLRGDCSLGYAEGGREVYAGLVRLAIERRLSAEYPDNVGYLACREDYDELERRVGGWLCDPFLAQIFAGAEEQVLAELAAEHFETTLRRYYFASSRTIFDGLAVAGVEQHVLSASPEVFVRSAAASLGLAPEGLHGIRVRIVEGRLTREVLHPITSAEGKTARLKEIVQTAQAETPDRPVFAIAAFGNDFATDGPFVAYVARQVLPAGTPLGVMINAGLAPAQYRHTFRSVRQVRVVADN